MTVTASPSIMTSLFTNVDEDINSQTTIQPEVQLSTVEKVIEVTILCMICITALVGNSLLWTVIIKTPSLRSTSSALLLCLSFADIMVSVINMPFTIYAIITSGWNLGELLCKSLGFTNMLTFVASVMSLGAISINRYVIIVRQKYASMASKKSTGILILGVWLLSALLASLPLLGWSEYAFIANQSFCFCRWTVEESYAYFMISMCFGGPCSIMLFCYWNILREVKRSRRRVCSRGPSMIEGVDREVSLRRFRRLFSVKRRDSQLSSISEIKENIVYSIADAVPMRKLSEESDENHTENNTEQKKMDHAIIVTSCSDYQLSERRKSDPTPNKLQVTYDIREANSDDGPSTRSPKREKSEPGNRTSPWKRQSSTVSIGMQKNSLRRRREGETKLAVTFLIVVFMFIVCWLPFCVTMIWNVYDKEKGGKGGPPRALDVATLILGYFNSCCNPIIYGIRNKKFRDAYKSIFQFRKKSFTSELNFKLKNGRTPQTYFKQ
ncbi:dopamine D2-like receptor [Anneissia japonica]|uniref:dopamine D2-like receptor n=1 Tax=Anneissia japonica TaxID=1529436 RepID=UPI001425B78A|nr:dopamine D2-like receptor [Anneissia japonica]XP_033125572.1 dopamine D2-like receptor [Anneissia japonica]